jgi:hypothetical protein
MVQGSGPLLPGFWARRVCIQESQGLLWGSMLPFIEQSQARGWGVVILNPNVDAPEIGRDHHQVIHALRSIIAPSQNVVIIAHSRGGASTADALRCEPELAHNVRCIALTNSTHSPQQITPEMRQISVHWVSALLLQQLLLLLMICR